MFVLVASEMGLSVCPHGVLDCVRSGNALSGSVEWDSGSDGFLLLQPASSKTAVGATAAVGAACDRIKSRLGARPSLNRARGAPASAPQALPPVSRQRPGRDVCSSASGGMCSPRAKQSTTAGKSILRQS